MPAAAKGKKKKGGTKKKKEKEPATPVSRYDGFDDQERKLLQSQALKNDWVYLDLKLCNWAFSNFTLLVRTNTPLSTIAAMIREKHGSISDLKMYRAPPIALPNLSSKGTPFVDWNATLKDVGILGGPKYEGVRGTIFYDFNCGLSGPLLNKHPNLLLPQGVGATPAPLNVPYAASATGFGLGASYVTAAAAASAAAAAGPAPSAANPAAHPAAAAPAASSAIAQHTER